MKNSFYRNCLKRVLDVIFSALAMLLFSWVYAIVALLVRVFLGRPVIFSQLRPGRNDPKTGKERPFYLYKFRSMKDLKDRNGRELPDDERLTKFGRILRSTSLDELPEAWNIFKGDMSIVGPRPLLMEYLPYYTEEEHHRHDVRPGLTGLAQVNGRTAVSWQKKFAYDLDYVRNCSFGLDLKIILQTVIKTVKKSDIYVGSAVPWGRFDDMRRKELAEAQNASKGEHT
ncbi:MAG: sugar transferase [Oscillospiraceae bacterium]|nr:sugar transferase [Oscillospiraceae bacterium]